MSNKKWLLFVAPKAYPCVTGGLEVFNHYLIDELKKKYPIHMLSNCDKAIYKGVVFHKLKWLKFTKITQPLLIMLFIIKNRKSIELVYLSYSRAYWTLWFIYVITKKLFGVQYGFTIHGGGLTKWKPNWPFRMFFKNANFITGVSHRIIDEYAKRIDRKIFYTPPLVPFSILDPRSVNREDWGVKIDETIILYVGSLKPLKSVDTLIEALGDLKIEKLEKYKLKVLIAGDGISKKQLMNRTKELGIENRVKFLGLVVREKIAELYSIADIYTICSEFEGLPISLLEAFANGLPSITSDAPGLINVSNHNKNSLMFKTKDFVDYSEKIEKLVCDRKLQNELKINAKIYYKSKFSYNVLIDEFKKIINNYG